MAVPPTRGEKDMLTEEQRWMGTLAAACLGAMALGNVVVWRTGSARGGRVVSQGVNALRTRASGASGGASASPIHNHEELRAASPRLNGVYETINKQQQERQKDLEAKFRDVVDALPKMQPPSPSPCSSSSSSSSSPPAQRQTPSTMPKSSRQFSSASAAAVAAAATTDPPSSSSTTSSHMDTFELLSRDDGLASVDSYGDSAFIVNGVLVSQQSLIIFGGTSLLWDVSTLEEATPQTAAALLLIRPVPEIVVIGCGSRARPSAVDPELMRALRAQGSAVEVMATAKAAALFNILNQEGRRVAGALIPAGTQ